MIIDSQLVTFTLVAAALTITPGADTMLVLRNVLAGGRRRGLATTVGICSGLWIHASLSALGLSVILAQSATAYGALKALGAAYLVWLGIQSLRAAWRLRGAVLADAEPARAASFRQSFTEGFVTNVLNPKVAVFYLAFLPQFVAADDPVLGKSLLLAGIHVVQGLLWLGGLSFVLDRGRALMLRPNVRRALDALCGSVLIALGARLALDSRSPV